MLHRHIAAARVLAGLVLLTLLGCQPAPAPTPTGLPSPLAPTTTVSPTQTAVPTLTATVAFTPIATATPIPPTRSPTVVPTQTLPPAATARATTAARTQLIGWTGGSNGSAVAAAGSYAYVAVGPRLIVLDISKPATPLVTGQGPILPEKINNLVVANGYAYVANGASGLYVLNISVPKRPEFAVPPTQVYARRVALSGSYLYVASPEGLRIYSITNPTHPTQVGVLGEEGGLSNVVVGGKYAYVIGDRTRIVDISDPTRPVQVGVYDLVTNPGDIAVSGSYALIGTALLNKNSPYRATVHVVDLSNPAKPTRVVEIPMNGPVSSIAIRDNLAFVAAVSQLHIYNLSDPRRMAEVANYSSTAEITDLALVGDQLLLTSSTGDSLSVLSIAHPERPTLIGAFSPPKSVQQVAVAGRYAYVADGLRGLIVLDISDPSAPVPIGASKPFFARDVVLQGDYAYLAAIDGLRIINVTDALHPVEVGGITLRDSGESVAVAGTRAYVAAGREFAIVDITHPDAPSVLSSISRTDALANDISLNTHYAYIAGGYGLRVIDVADSAHPREIAFLQSRDWDFAVSTVGDYVYLASGSAGLRIVSVSDASKPVEVGTAPAHNALGVTVSGNRAYVSDTISGLHIVNVSDPRKPIEVELVRGQVSPRRVTVAGEYLCVTNLEGALAVLRRGE